ncbi:hypothetical protein D3C81_2092450 [compost metagenome]
MRTLYLRYSLRSGLPSVKTTMAETGSEPWILELSKASIRRTVPEPSQLPKFSTARTVRSSSRSISLNFSSRETLALSQAMSTILRLGPLRGT